MSAYPLMTGLIDCNNFFVSCERVFHPELRDRPVIVLGNNDGCVVAMSNEAKALGITRGIPLFKIRDIVSRHNIAVLSGNHRLYSDMSSRVMMTLASLADGLEISSIDEAYINLDAVDDNELPAYGQSIVKTIKKNVGIPVSLGIASTRTLAKAAARFAKKYPGYKGACIIDTPDKRAKALELTGIGDVWGIGRRLSERLKTQGIYTALDFARLSKETIRDRYNINLERVWRELNGEACIGTEESIEGPQKSLTCSRTFATEIYSLEELNDAVAQHAAYVAERLRRHGCHCSAISVYIATNRFKESYYSNIAQHRMPEATNDTSMLCKEAKAALAGIFRPGYGYKRAGVTATQIIDGNGLQQSLFCNHDDLMKRRRLMSALDKINRENAGHDKVHLASIPSKSVASKEHTSRLYTTRMSDIIDIKCVDPSDNPEAGKKD